MAPRSRLLAEEVSGPTPHCLLLALWIRRRRADSEIQGSSFGRVDRCVFRIWPARATPSASRAAASANARIGRATRPQLTAHVGSAGFIGKSAIWRPPATRSGTRAHLSKRTGMNGGRQGAMADVLKETERKNYGQNCECRAYVLMAAIAQLAARRSHNPKVVSSILTCRMPGQTHLS